MLEARKFALAASLLLCSLPAPLAAQHRFSRYGGHAGTVSVSPGSIKTTATQGTNPSASTLEVKDSNGGALSFTASSDSSWLGVSPNSGTTPSSLILSYNLGSASAGTYTGHVNVSASGSSDTVTVTVTVSAASSTTQPPKPTTYGISGAISPAPSGSVGYTVTLTPNNIATTTNASGQYSFPGLAAGTYTVTPSATGYSFSPPSLQVTISSANATGENFSATSSTTSSSGNQVFYDDFTASALSSDWYAMNKFGDTSNGEVQCYTPGQDQLSGGYLVITSAVQSVTCGQNGSSKSSYNSGMVTWSTFNFTYGTVEFRAKMAGGQGPWPAIWLLGYNCQATNVYWTAAHGNCNWPAPGSDEIDITEILNSDHTSVNQQLHSNGHNDGCTATTTDVSQNFHVYQFIWSAGSMVWKIDGNTTCTIKQSYVPDTPMFLIINTAMGGSGGSINNSSLPQTMQVDYVKVTQP